MARLYIAEFAEQGRDIANQLIPAPVTPAIATQDITGTTSSVASAAFNTKTRLVLVSADADAVIDFGSSPTAVSGSGVATIRIPADSPLYFHVQPGDKVAVKDA